MHQGMSLCDRLENLLTGYILLDLFKLLSQKECRRRGLPAGSLWMAPQSHKNIQSCVMGLVTALLTKDPCSGDPWRVSHHRLTELPIEMFFGRLRQRAVNSQFNARQYWQQCAAEMVRVGKMDQGRTDTSVVKPLTDQEFQQASRRAMKSSIQLAAWCAGVTEESLRAAYHETAHGLISASEASQPFHDWERDEQEDWEEQDADKQDGEQGSASKWQSLLKHVRDEAEASLKATGGGGNWICLTEM